MTGNGVAARLRRVFSAQLYSQLTTIAVQLALVPVLLHLWGTERYGVWLLLSAVPTYLTFSDFGFTFIAKNEMVMQVAAGDRAGAMRTYQSVFALINIVAPVMLVLAAAIVHTVDFGAIAALRSFPETTARNVLMLLILNVVLYQYALLLSAGIRSENRAASESTWAATARLGEGAAIGIVALAGGSLLAAALATLANRLLFNLLIFLWLRRHSPWLALGRVAADRAELRRLLHPALGYMFVPVSLALLIQGPVMVLGALAGPLAVVVYATSRTLARLGTAGTNVLNNTLVTEYSAIAGRGGAGFARMLRLHMIASGAAVAAYSLAVLLLDRPLMHVFTHGKVAIVQPFFAIVVAAVAAEMMWTALFTPLTAVNRHVAVTHWLLGLSLAGLAACYPLARQFGLTGAALAVLSVHLAMIVICLVVGRPGRGAAGRMRPALPVAADPPGSAGEGGYHAG